jgi:hypothetical protein
VTWQLSLLELPMPSDAAPVWDALVAEERAAVVSVLVRLMAKQVAHDSEPGSAAEQEKSRG